MAGEAYLKVAAANIRRAASEKQREISAKTTDLDRKQADIQREIDECNRQITQKDGEMARSEINSARRMQLMHETQELRATIEAKRREFTQVHDEIKRQIADVENNIRDLQGKASEFEQAWGV